MIVVYLGITFDNKERDKISSSYSFPSGHSNQLDILWHLFINILKTHLLFIIHH